jgi:hypothetical protein
VAGGRRLGRHRRARTTGGGARQPSVERAGHGAAGAARRRQPAPSHLPSPPTSQEGLQSGPPGGTPRPGPTLGRLGCTGFKLMADSGRGVRPPGEMPPLNPALRAGRVRPCRCRPARTEAALLGFAPCSARRAPVSHGARAKLGLACSQRRSCCVIPSSTLCEAVKPMRVQPITESQRAGTEQHALGSGPMYGE